MNHLENQSSPYLAQHKNNPVDWWPWCKDAFDLALAKDLPIFLSIGYASCHWCHVMAHESFEDPGTAELLNKGFISIKVDREERPDVDALYMEAVQAITGSGGWPMSIFMTADGRPFFAGTYFPPSEGRGLPSFKAVLNAMSNAWINQRAEVENQALQIANAITARTQIPTSGIALKLSDGPDYLANGAANLLQSFDPRWGGFGHAPKFPQAHLIELLVNYYLKSKSLPALEAVTTTLDAMASGGIYDHLGGGFSRYSVDNEWLVPHFEKMLYDQAQLAKAYTIGWAVTKNPNWKQVVRETIEYTLRDLHGHNTGLFSSQDADSEGVEGKYYLFRPEEIIEVLGQPAGEFIKYYGVTQRGNFEGSNILHRPIRGDLIRTPAIEKSREVLLRSRYQRVPPGLDDKVILEWNAMFIATLAQAGFIFKDHYWIDKAESLLATLESRMYLNGRWMRIWQGNKVTQPAFAGDYAQLIDAYTRTYEATGKPHYILKATRCANELIELFQDTDDGGFFTTGSDQERLLVRTKEIFDGAIPSSNSIAARSLARLGILTDNRPFMDAASRVINLVGDTITSHPSAFPVLVQTMTLLSQGSQEIVIPGFNDPLVDVLRGRWLPDAVSAFGEKFESPLWLDRKEGLAYICKGFSCLEPIAEPQKLALALDSLA